VVRVGPGPLDLDGGDALAHHVLDRAPGIGGLVAQVHRDLAAVGAGPVQHVEVGERRHGDAEERAGFTVPVLVERFSLAADDLEMGEVVRRLEPRREDEHVDHALDTVGVDDAAWSNRRHGPRHQLHVRLLQKPDRRYQHVALGLLAGGEREPVDVTIVVPHRALHTGAEAQMRLQG
jgi:hypothetical protein